ncbi:MAG TPA: glycosyl hydrolase family 18 protein [Streptosporangiaceae bacterium]|nr:glycosyl hydrolase family 18 protein [Streptosporangiaceae bacterium]
MAWLAVLPAGILAVVLTVYAYQTVSATTTTPRLVVASVPFWNLSQGTGSVLAHRQDVNEVSPWMYGLSPDSAIVLDSGVSQPEINRYLSEVRGKGLPVVPTLANIDGRGNWTYAPVARMLHDPALMARQVTAITTVVEDHGYAGIDIDYEELHAGDRQAFSTFVTHLAAALHARHKILSVALFAKATDAGYAPRNIAQDYAAVGKAADQVRLMGYDYHWATSPPGPVAPVTWLRAVLRYAKTLMPAKKIILGIPMYGYDWSGGHGAALTWAQAMRLTEQYHVKTSYDPTSQAPWFRYTDPAGHQHTVWFENAASAKAKFTVAKQARIGGVYLWMYGDGDPAMWSGLSQILPIGARLAVPAPQEMP